MTTDRARRLDPEALKTFVEVARQGSFSAAAERLNKTPAAISYRIRALEENMGTPLFERTTRSVTLTPAGELLLERATQIFEWMQHLPEELQQVNDGVEPRFHLVINNLLFNAESVGGLLATLSRSFPHTSFRVRRAVYMGVWDEMVYGGGHFAIGIPGWHPISDAFETLPLGQIEWVLVMSPAHPLAGVQQPLTNDLLRQYPAVNVEDTSERLSKRTAWLLTGQHEVLVPSMRAKIAAHVHGLGVGFLPRSIAEQYVRTRQLVIKQVRHGRTPSPMALAWRREDSGRIGAYLQALFAAEDPLVSPFLNKIQRGPGLP